MTQTLETGRYAERRSAPTAPAAPSSEERPIGVILTDLWEKAETLLRQEKTLALTEAEEKVRQLKGELAAYALAGAVLFAAGLVLASALVLLLSKAMDPWLAALLVGVVLGGGGYALLQRKSSRGPSPRQLVPQQTIESLKNDVQTMTERK